jgi:hypothetical protein
MCVVNKDFKHLLDARNRLQTNCNSTTTPIIGQGSAKAYQCLEILANLNKGLVGLDRKTFLGDLIGIMANLRYDRAAYN